MTKKLKTTIVLGGLAAGLLVTAAVLYYQNHGSNPTTTPSDQSNDTAQDLPTPSAGQSAPSGEPDKNQTPESGSNQSSPKPQTSSFTLTLTRAGQPQAGGNVQIRALVEGATSGQCQVAFSGPGTAFSKTSAITYDGRTYSCGALDAAASEFSQGGSWNYSLGATSGSGTSNTINGQVTVSK